MHIIILSTILIIFFPIWIRLQGKDAITTGSIAILLTGFIFVQYALIGKKKHFQFALIVPALILAGFISAFSVASPMLGPSLRGLTQFICALLGFFLVTNYYKDLPIQERMLKIEFVLSFIIALFIVQVIIGVILYFIPSFGSVLSIFTTRTEEVFATPIVSGVKRLKTIIVAQETLGEIMAILMPLVLYLLVRKGGFYFIAYGIFALGVTLSATRTSILLFLIGSIVFVLVNFRLIAARIWFLSLFTISLLLIIYFSYFPHALDPVISRFSEFINLYERTGSFTMAIGRKDIWDIGAREIIAEINLFGHGMITYIRGEHFNLHNLYLTILYQMGIVGFFLYFGLIASVIIVQLKSLPMVTDPLDRCLLKAILISLTIFLLSEFKCEFNRGSSYQQIVWILLGLYYLASCTLQEKCLIPHQSER